MNIFVSGQIIYCITFSTSVFCILHVLYRSYKEVFYQIFFFSSNSTDDSPDSHAMECCLTTQTTSNPVIDSSCQTEEECMYICQYQILRL